MEGHLASVIHIRCEYHKADGILGITRFDQIAAWDDADIDRIDAQLGRFQGRIRRDNWVEQAKYLAAGDRVAFEDRFGKT